MKKKIIIMVAVFMVAMACVAVLWGAKALIIVSAVIASAVTMAIIVAVLEKNETESETWGIILSSVLNKKVAIALIVIAAAAAIIMLGIKENITVFVEIKRTVTVPPLTPGGGMLGIPTIVKTTSITWRAIAAVIALVTAWVAAVSFVLAKMKMSKKVIVVNAVLAAVSTGALLAVASSWSSWENSIIIIKSCPAMAVEFTSSFRLVLSAPITAITVIIVTMIITLSVILMTIDTIKQEELVVALIMIVDSGWLLIVLNYRAILVFMLAMYLINKIISPGGLEVHPFDEAIHDLTLEVMSGESFTSKNDVDNCGD